MNYDARARHCHESREARVQINASVKLGRRWVVAGPSLIEYPIHHSYECDAGGAVNPAV